MSNGVDMSIDYAKGNPVYPKWVVVDVKPEDDYCLLVDFIDGSKKKYDVKPLIEKYEVFKKLKDVSEFNKVHIEGPTVVWDDMLDIAPESLYEKGIPVE